MADNSETGNGDEPEKTRRASHHAMRDAEQKLLNVRAAKDQILPSRLFAIFAGLDEATTDERRFLEQNPDYREVGEQIAKSLKDLQRKAEQRNKNRQGPSR
jgi:hypothetical protein